MKKIQVWLCVMLLLGLAFNAQAQTQSELEKELNDLRAWMKTRSSQADSVIRKEWPTVKNEFRELSYSLDSNTKKLSEESKSEYSTIKQQYKEWEERNETRKAVSFEKEELERWEREMVGTTKINKIKAANLRDAFVRALEYTRGSRRNWSLRDWDYAEFVFGELNTRKSELQGHLNSSDKIKIAALQVEFASLKKSRDAKDAFENMKEKK
ncbi:hypothetical protein [Pontibacter harenae]|uniref:hypothetical protein n=1 Tax=Pontibacter harenae TaxID=2894083 RepID=UPI001E519991|nr:hypothetical protein [Pontibacter harenae]MCC9167658.1 hypothetical protein [Pontibacter harenae]